MSLTRRALAVLALVGLTTLTGCGSGTTGASTSSASAAPTNPTLSVPATSDSRAIAFHGQPGQFDAGTSLHVAVYGGSFTQPPNTCTTEVTSTTVTVAVKGQSFDGSVTIPHAGAYRLVVSGPGFSSPCAGEAGIVRALNQPEIWLDGDLAADGEQTKQAARGKPVEVAVILGGEVPTNRPLSVTVTAYGPFQNEPEMRAAQCADNTVAKKSQLRWNGNKKTSAQNLYQNTTITLDGKPGLYLLTAEVPEQAQSATATTECDNYQQSLKVAVK